jgi:CCR4-NOT transcription complex subunit 6
MQRADFKKTDDIFDRILNRDHHAVVCLLESKETGTRFLLANAHIFWDPHYADVKLVQTALMVEELEKMADRFARYPPRPPAPADASGAPAKPAPTYSDGYKIPLIVCSDLNSVPKSGVCDFMTNGHVPPTHPDFGPYLYGRYTSEGPRHKLGLKSAYAALEEFSLTNHTPNFDAVVDYIWYSTQNVAVNAVLGEVDKGYLEKVVGFPNAHFPSE